MAGLTLMVVGAFALGFALRRMTLRAAPEKPKWARFLPLILLAVPIGAAIRSGLEGYFLWQLSAAIWLITALFYALGCLMGGI